MDTTSDDKLAKIETGELEETKNLTDEARYLIQSWRQYQVELQKTHHQETWEISQVFGFIALLYERVRNTIENKDEHVIRRYAIERALTRLDPLNKTNEEKAERLVKELTWSRFLPNNSITKGQLLTLVRILDKYEAFQKGVLSVPLDNNLTKAEVKTWIISIQSTEIEESLVPSFTRLHMVPTMFVWLKKFAQFTGTERPIEELEMQAFLATHRALAKSDNPILRYHLFLLYHPQWPQVTNEQVGSIAQQFQATYHQIEDLLHDRHKNQIFRQVKKNTAPFIILEQIMRQSPDVSTTFKHPDLLIQSTQEVAEQKYAAIKQNLRHGTIKSILYILATKVLFALLIEVPYEKYVVQHIHYLSIGVNLTLPPLLMFLMAQTVKVPGHDNTKRVIDRVNNIIYKSDDLSQHLEIKVSSLRKNKLSKVFNAIYVYVFIVTSILIAYFLMELLKFNIVSTALFFMFVSMVLLLGFRLRWQSQELLVDKPKHGLFDHLFSILSIPFINIGVWLSNNLSKINILTFLLDRVVDAPLKSSVNSAEEWTQFLKSKQQEAVEVPGD